MYYYFILLKQNNRIKLVEKKHIYSLDLSFFYRFWNWTSAFWFVKQNFPLTKTNKKNPEWYTSRLPFRKLFYLQKSLLFFIKKVLCFLLGKTQLLSTSGGRDKKWDIEYFLSELFVLWIKVNVKDKTIIR